MKPVNLLIVESPSKCSKIESYLGPEYKCIASKGHIRELSGLKSIDVNNNFHPTFDIISEKKDHIKKMKEIISTFDKTKIYVATDDDREGEAIAWHICQVFGLDVSITKRILFREITKTAILDSLNHVTRINMNIIHAQQTRQILDIIVGFNISPVLWKKIYYSKSNALSAGRCQTPALRLIYENQKERGGEIETKYKTTGYFFSKNIPFELNHSFFEESDIISFLEKNKTFSHKMIIEDPRDKTKSPPKPFNTSNLLQCVNNNLHYSPKQTMQICQNLYQGGHITYMRTENTKYAKLFLDQAETFIVDNFVNREYLGNMSDLENKDKNNPHEAIRVTDILLKELPESSDSKERALYKLIWKNTVESCMSCAKYKSFHIKITAPSVSHEKKVLFYEHALDIPHFLGWEKLFPKKETDQQTLFFLQSVSKSVVPYSYIESVVTVQSRHSHYSESSLIKKLEDLGIGRPSTFATIVDTIQDRGYVEKKDIKGETLKCKEYKLMRDAGVEIIDKEKVFGGEKNKLSIKPLGTLCIEFLINHFKNLFEYNYTENLETQLDLIACGAVSPWYSICDNYNKDILRLIEESENLDKKVYKLDETHEVCFQQYGPVIRSKDKKGKFVYEKINPDITIDLEKLESGQYEYSELAHSSDSVLGSFKDEDVIIKQGKYGPYIAWNKINIGIKDIPSENVTLESAIEMIKQKLDGSSERKPTVSNDILRIINSDIHVRKGKFGPYLYYKTATMKTPKFINLKNFSGDIMRCGEDTAIQWIANSSKK
jgi:DNA topoisomerase-1